MAGEGHTDGAQAWTAFWREQGDGSRCLTNAHPDVRQALDRHWSSFAARLSPAAGVLDIGCGAGVVATSLLAAHEGLRITGIDLADIPPTPGRRFEIVPATRMEALPFADSRFDAAVSQFGFEYGTTADAARELARVLVPGAPFSFLIHHSESSVVNHNRARNRALRELCGETAASAFRSGNTAALDQEVRSIARQYPGETIVGQIAQALFAHIGRNEAHRAAIWAAVLESLAPEREILDALEASCVPPERLDAWLDCFAGLFDIDAASALRRASGEAIAWQVEGRKKAAGVAG